MLFHFVCACANMEVYGGDSMTEGHKKTIAIVAFVIFILFCVAAGYYIGLPMIRLVEEPEVFRDWVDSYGIWSRLIFLGMVVLQVVVAFIPGEPIELAAGYAFGFWEGTVLTLAGFLLGSLLVYLLVRHFGTQLVEVFFSSEKIRSFSFLKNSEKTKTIAFLLMLIPGTPKDFLSYFAGLTQLSLKSWMMIVAIARLPSLVTSTATGAAAGEQNYVLTVVMLGITVILTLAGLYYYRLICKQQKAEEMDGTKK